MRAKSLLRVTVGGLPEAHGTPTGEWHYRHAVRPEGVTPLDHEAVADFIGYEQSHGRDVSVVCDPELSDWADWPVPATRVSPHALATQCCSQVFPAGCGSQLVCHGTTAEAASRILAEGKLRCAVDATGRGAEELAATSPWGEPPDYFEHIMFADGRCLAPEAVAHSRRVGHDLVPADLVAGYPPAVRFYLRWDALVDRPDARFDGVHVVKIRRELPVEDALVACVLHERDRDTVAVTAGGELAGRVVVLELEQPKPDEWATAALAAATRLE